MGKNKEQRAASAAKVGGAVALAPAYLHKHRVDLFAELFENLDVSGDGSLEPAELTPAFTALSDDVLRHASPAFVRKLFALVDKSADGNVDLSEFLVFFSRLTSAMALALGRPPHEHVQDPAVFVQQFVVLLRELAAEEGASTGDNGDDGDAEESRDELAKNKAMLKRRQKARAAASLNSRSGVDGGDGDAAEAMPGTAAWAASSAALQGDKHQAESIFDVSDPQQLHRHVKWLAAQVEAAAAEGAATKRELAHLRQVLGGGDRGPPRFAAARAPPLPQPVPGPPPQGYPQPAVAAERARLKRAKALRRALGAGGHAGRAYRDQWESKLAATRRGGGTAAAAAAACQALGADGRPDAETTRLAATLVVGAAAAGTTRAEAAGAALQSALSGGSDAGDLCLADAWAAESGIAAAAASLAQEWAAAASLAADASAAADAAARAETANQSAEHLPVPQWLAVGGWRQLKNAVKVSVIAADASTP
jgi:hypothetical protein